MGDASARDLGAEVIKIEDPSSGGDVGRYVPPFQEGEDSLFFETFNRNKKSISLDLRHPEARGVIEDRPRRRRRLLEPARRPPEAAADHVRRPEGREPARRLLLLSGFGMTGPRAAEGGYDYMMQGLAGG